MSTSDWCVGSMRVNYGQWKENIDDYFFSMAIHIDNQVFVERKLSQIEQFKQAHPSVPFNHKIYRALIRKLRRQISRQHRAKERDERIRLQTLQLEHDPLYQAWLVQKEHLQRQREIDEERENNKARQLWEQREQIEINKIKQLVTNQERVRRVTEQKKKDAILARNIFPTHNPFAPMQPNPPPAIERPVCKFYSKTGVCRYNERCHRVHHKPDITNTLLALNMYSNFEMQYGLDDEYDADIGLEFEESERYANFKDFYSDVRPEFTKYGHVTMFKVCSNFEVHLRGNVYVEYETTDEAMKAYLALNTRYYAGRMVQCQFVNIPSWSAAICGLYELGKCPKGRRCNYLHVFRNPADKIPKDSKSREPSRKRKRHHS